ncbi:MAG: hypothetical protein HZA17_11540 [Nitrospirae bacterium]|nr:hypothetical protein [Nitrospirota bacterium]
MIDFVRAHEILKDFGLDVEARNCLAQNHQLIDIATIIFMNKGLGDLDEETANRLAKENRLLRVARTIAKELDPNNTDREITQASPVSVDETNLSNQKAVLLEKAHGILKKIGLDVEARNCLAKDGQLLNIAALAESKGFGELEAVTLNTLAKENRIMEAVSYIEQGTMFQEKADQILEDVGLDT